MYAVFILLTIVLALLSGSADNVVHVTTWWHRRDHDFRRRILWGKPTRQCESADRQRWHEFADDRVVPSHYARIFHVQPSRGMGQVDPPIQGVVHELHNLPEKKLQVVWCLMLEKKTLVL